MSGMHDRRRHASGGPPKQSARADRLAFRNRRLTALFVIAAAIVLVVVFGARKFVGLSSRSAGQPLNLLLVTLDTTRADHIGAYGYAFAKTSHLDRLAAEGVRFDRAVAPAPITLPSHASLFTARYPFAHGVRNNGNFYLSDNVPTLTTALHDRGYRTAAFVSSFILDRRYGLARGFDEYDDRLDSGKRAIVNFQVERRGDVTALKANEWLDAYAREAAGRPVFLPFFLWLHLYDPHEPYRPPHPFRDMFADRPYDGEIAFDDSVVAAVMDRLDRLGLLASTVIAVVGDHGESLGDHGEQTHSMFVYESALRVPMILWRPGRLPAGTVVKPLVRAIDLAPTLLDLVGAAALPGAEGRSLLPLINGRDAPPGSAYAETYLPLFYMNWSPLRSLQDERWKYIDAPAPELYDLDRDPHEAENLADRERPRAAALKRALDEVAGSGQGSMTVGRLDREALEKLAALGYVAAGGGDAQPARLDGRADPKSMIAVFNRLRSANAALRDGRFGEAIAVARAVLAEDPQNAFATIIVAGAQMNQGRYRDAIAGYRAYLNLVPTSAYAHHWIAICELRLGNQDRALAEEDAALAIDPHYADARVLKGGVHASRGQYDAAVRELTQAVDTDPAKAALRLDLAKVLVDAKRLDEADAQYRRALELDPTSADAHTGYGVLLATRGARDAASRELQRALELDPQHDEARFDLGKLLEEQGKAADARAQYEIVSASETAPPAIRRAAQERMKVLR
jgi:choline-sulfatase